MSGNRARVGRAHSRLKTMFVFLTAFLSFWCGRAVSSLEPIWRWWEDRERQLAASLGLERGRGQETFQKHLNTLLSSKEPDTRISSGTTFLGSIMCGDSIKNVSFTVFSLPLPGGGSLSCGQVTLSWPEALPTPSDIFSCSLQQGKQGSRVGEKATRPWSQGRPRHIFWLQPSL